MSKKTTNTLPSGAPDDGNEEVRAAAAAASDTKPDVGSPSEIAELITRVDAAEQRAAAAEDRARAAEELVGNLSAGNTASKVVSAEIKKRDNIHAANRLLRLEAKTGLKSRMGKRPEEMKLVVFQVPWKRGIYQPDGKAYAFSPELAARLVSSGVASYPSQGRVGEIHQARINHQAESVARRHISVD